MKSSPFEVEDERSAPTPAAFRHFIGTAGKGPDSFCLVVDCSWTTEPGGTSLFKDAGCPGAAASQHEGDGRVSEELRPNVLQSGRLRLHVILCAATTWALSR